MDPKFGAEIITTKGKVYKFDDMICFQQFLRSGILSDKEIRSKLVINFEKPDDFMDLNKAFFIISPTIKSPMSSGAAGFESRATAEKANTLLQGEVLTWNSLSEKIK
jgi:copper chaperone NosL